jgi:ATP-dependent Clp protease ATP-binding subunit ClpX
LGARGLRSIIEDLMLDLMFDVPSNKSSKIIRVTKRMVEKNSPSMHPQKQAAGV